MHPRLLWISAIICPSLLVCFYFLSLWKIEQYQFYPVLLLCVGGILFNRWNKDLALPNKYYSLALIATLAITLMASLFFSPWLGFVSLVLILSIFCATHREKYCEEGFEPITAGNLLYITIPLWLCVRVPLNLDQKLTTGLQHFTAKISSRFLDQLAIPHQLSGVVFELASGKLLVEEACSGIQSFFAILCIAFLLVTLNRRSLASLPLYIAAAIFSACLFNIIRVVTIALSQEVYGVDLSKGWKHTLLGYICLVLAILLLASFDRLFRIVLFPISFEEGPDNPADTTNVFTSIWNRLFCPATPINNERTSCQNGKWLALTVSTLAALAVFAQVVNAISITESHKSPNQAFKQHDHPKIWEPQRDLFAVEKDLIIEQFQQISDGSDISEGQNVDVWTVLDSKTELRHRIAISQTYVGFHDLCICYSGQGWRIGDKTVIRQKLQDLDLGTWGFTYSNWFNDNGSYGYLSFSSLNYDNTETPIPEETLYELLTTRIGFGPGYSDTTKESFILQVWTITDSPLTPEEQQEIKKLHVRLRQSMRQAFLKTLKNSANL